MEVKRASRKGIEITAHKGGRTEFINRQRCTPEVAEKFEEVVYRLEISKADFMEMVILEKSEEIFGKAESV